MMSFEAKGWERLGVVLEAGEVDELRQAIEAWAPTAPANEYGLLFNNLWCALPAFQRLVLDGRVAAQARAALGVEAVQLFQDNLVCKVPGNLTEIQWHQDYSYWPLDAPRGITTWLALDDADEENGALAYVPGSHLWGERAPADFIRGTGQPALPGLIPMDPEGRVTALGIARAGELLVHHPLVWHRSGPNRSARPRRAWTATWIVPGTRWALGHAPHPYTWSLRPQDGAVVEGELFPVFGG